MIAANLPEQATFEDWRHAARNLIAIAAEPESVVWRSGSETDLFASAPTPNLQPAVAMTVPRMFVAVAEKATLHSDPQRFALLYRLLWRLQRDRHLMEDTADPDIVALNALAKAVRRDEHKMHAFVRFREVTTLDGPRFVAWFEPQHNIVAASADFFFRRFAGMRWSIITPRASIHWDGDQLSHGPGGVRADVRQKTLATKIGVLITKACSIPRASKCRR